MSSLASMSTALASRKPDKVGPGWLRIPLYTRGFWLYDGKKKLKVGGDDGIDSENRAGEAGGGSHGGAGPSAANSGPAGAGWSETAEQRQ